MENNPVALITGASSGIGRAFALNLAGQGYNLIITGRTKEIIETLAEHLTTNYHILVETLIVDLANEADLEKVVNTIKQTRKIHILINNAGFGTAKYFLNVSIEDQQKMIKVHILAPITLVHAVLPNMIIKGEGIIINVASMSSRIIGPSAVMYSASKSFLKLFSEALYMEQLNSGIIIQALCPGFTKTDFHEKLGMNNKTLKSRGIARWMTSEEVVKYSLSNLRKGQVICVPGFWNKFIWYFSLFVPRYLYYRIAAGYEGLETFFGGRGISTAEIKDVSGNLN